MKQVTIFCDGCSLGNPGPAGAGILLVYGDIQKQLAIPLGETTNNRAELAAIIEALKALKAPCIVELYSDSENVVKCANGEYTRQSNLDLWRQYEEVVVGHTLTIQWIRKDSHQGNRIAHKLANQAAYRNT